MPYYKNTQELSISTVEQRAVANCFMMAPKAAAEMAGCDPDKLKLISDTAVGGHSHKAFRTMGYESVDTKKGDWFKELSAAVDSKINPACLYITTWEVFYPKITKFEILAGKGKPVKASQSNSIKAGTVLKVTAALNKYEPDPNAVAVYPDEGTAERFGVVDLNSLLSKDSFPIVGKTLTLECGKNRMTAEVSKVLYPAIDLKIASINYSSTSTYLLNDDDAWRFIEPWRRYGKHVVYLIGYEGNEEKGTIYARDQAGDQCLIKISIPGWKCLSYLFTLTSETKNVRCNRGCRVDEVVIGRTKIKNVNLTVEIPKDSN